MNNKLYYSSLLFISLFSSIQAFSQIGIQKHHLHGGSQFEKSNKVMITSSGDRLIVGATESADGDFSNGVSGNDFDLFLMMTDDQNNLLWTRTYGGSQFESGVDMIETDNGDFIVLAETNSTDGDVTTSLGSKDAWLLKLKGDGSIIWQKSIGGNGTDHGSKIVSLPNGNVAILGYSNSTNLVGTTSLGDKDGWLCILDTDGTVISNKLFGGSDFDLFSNAVIGQNELFVVGSTLSADNTNAPHFGGFDQWILSMDFQGAINWEKTYGAAGNDFCNRVVLDDQDGIVTLGTMYSDVSSGLNSDDISLNHFDNAGNILWKKTFGGTGKDVGNAIVKTGNQYLIGCTTSSTDGGVSTSFGGNDEWFLLLNENGIVQQEFNHGGADDDQLVDIIPTNDPSVFVVVAYSESFYTESNGGFDVEIFELVLNANQAGTFELTNSNVTVFPNPTTEFVTINANGQDLGTVKLIDNSGKVIMIAVKNNTGSYNFNVSNSPNGVYFIHAENVTTPLKVVKF